MDKTTAELLNELKEEFQLDLSIDESTEINKDADKKLALILKALRSSESRSAFIIQTLNDNIDEFGYESAVKRFKISSDAQYLMYLVSFDESFTDSSLEILKNIFDTASCDILQMNESDIVILKKISRPISADDIEATASEIHYALLSEAMEKAAVAYDTTSFTFDKASACYRNLKLTMNVGRQFFADKDIYNYSDLGITSLLYQLPATACKDYMKKNLPGLDFGSLDAETMNTVKTFLNCNLSISETARVLYLHRNTLVYRLDAFKKQTGLDLRKFDDAMKVQTGLYIWYML